MKRIALITLTLIVTALVATIAVAQMHSGHEQADMAAFIAKELQLTPDQQAVFDSAHAEFQATAQPLIARQRDLGRQIETAVKSSSVDACAVGNLVIAQHAIGQQIQTAHEALKQKVEAVLTPEQKTKAEAMMAMHEHRAPVD